MIGLMSIYIYLQPPVPAAFRGLIIPGIMVLYLIPTIYYSKRLSNRMEALREQEGTQTPKREYHELSPKSLTNLFLGCGLIVAFSAMPIPMFMGQWPQVLLMLLAAFGWSLLARCFAGPRLGRCRFFFAIGTGLVALTCLGIYYTCVSQWRETLENASFWFLAGIQAQSIILVLMMVTVRQKYFRT